MIVNNIIYTHVGQQRRSDSSLSPRVSPESHLDVSLQNSGDARHHIQGDIEDRECEEALACMPPGDTEGGRPRKLHLRKGRASSSSGLTDQGRRVVTELSTSF